MPGPDAIVVGAGPNGLAAAITLAQAGLSVQVREGAPRVGGGLSSDTLTLPGFLHDVGSAVHPLGIASPFFASLPLERHGLEWVQPPAPLAHPLDGGDAVLLERSLAATARGLGEDGRAWERLMAPLVPAWPDLLASLASPLRLARHPDAAVLFAWSAAQTAERLVRRRFRTERARSLFAGIAAHAAMPLDTVATSLFGLALAVSGHAVGWPIPRGGAQSLADALTAHLVELGGEVLTGAPVHSLDALPPARAVLLDVTPRQLLRLAGPHLPRAFRRRLERYRYGPAVFKVDWALDGPIPWASAACARAGTVHVVGGLEEVAASERAAFEGRVCERPFVLLAQPTLFDPSRAPPGKHVGWAYCHVPHGSEVDMTEAIERQVERFAPGFRERILARSTLGPAALERRNPNLVGGDIYGGSHTFRQLALRPVPGAFPYITPLPGVYLCSSSTPPGGGVHGLCGWLAARRALRERFDRSWRRPPPTP